MKPFEHANLKSTILEMLNNGISSASQLAMTCDIRGIEITTDFIGCLLELLALMENDNAFKIVKQMIKRGMFVDRFREKSIVSLMLSVGMHNTRMRQILDCIARTRPGIIIGTYLKLERPSKLHKLDEHIDQFVMSLSAKLAKKNSEYQNKYHKKVVEIYENNWNLQHAMK